MNFQKAFAAAALVLALLFTAVRAVTADGETPSPAVSATAEQTLAPEASPTPGEQTAEPDASPATAEPSPTPETPTAAAQTAAQPDGQGHSLLELLEGHAARRAPGMVILPENADHMGPMCLEAGAAMSLGGHSLAVYGDLSIGGTLTIGAGKLTVYGNLIIKGGLLVMTNAADKVEVTGAFIADGADETGKLAAGSIKVSGDFVQKNTHSIYSYNETGSHTTTLSGANKTVKFTSPLGSAIKNPVFLSGTTFASGSKTISYKYTIKDGTGSIVVTNETCPVDNTYLSLSHTLTANYAIAAPNLYFMGTQGSWGLTVSGGSLTIPAGAARTATGGISAVNIIVDGALTLSTAGKTIAASGNITARGTLNQSAGTITAATFDAYGAVNLTGGALTVTGRYTRHAEPEGDSLIAVPSGSALTVSKDSGTQFVASAPAIRLSGSLGGKRASVTGALTVPGDAALKLGGGRLDAAGAMTVSGALDMAEHAEVVAVRGKFTAESIASGAMTDGYLVLYGGFEQKGAASFLPTGSHSALFCGDGSQSADFADPGSSSFANLYALDGALTQAQLDSLPATGAKALTGTTLNDISVDGGGALALYPDFIPTTFDYVAVVPEGISAVTVTPVKAYANTTATLLVGGAAHPGGIDVPPAGAAAATIRVMNAAGEPYAGAGAPFCATYALTLQPENTKLNSPGIAYALDKPFAADTLEYAVTVPVKDSQITLTPALANPNASLQYVCDAQQTSGASFARGIDPGQTVVVDVVVTAYHTPAVATPAVRTYRFTFRRESLLDGISLSGGFAANEAFAWNTPAYTADITAQAWTVTVTPQKGDGCASCVINGAAADSTALLPDFGASATADITLADTTGTYTRTYRVTVRRPALLSGISIASPVGTDTVYAATAPAFSSAAHAYAAIVPVNASATTVSGARVLPGCTGLTVGGQPDSYTLDIAPGAGAFVTLEASAGEAAQQKASYTVTLHKPLISGLSASAGSFTVPFSIDPASATSITLPYTEPAVVLSPARNDAGAQAVAIEYKEGGVALGAGAGLTVALAQGQTRTIEINAAYLTTSAIYTVRITREKSNNANLNSLGAGSGWLSPSFAATATNYTLLLTEKMPSVRLSPALSDTNSTYRIDSLAAGTPGTVSLALNGSATVKIVVTALRGNTKTYTVTVRRANIVTSVSGSPAYRGYAALSPGGTDRLTFSYRLSMPATVKLEIRRSGRWYTLLQRSEPVPGTKTFVWEGKLKGKYPGAGTYYVRMTPYYAGKAGTVKTIKVRILPKPSVYVTYLYPSTFRPTGKNALKFKARWTQLCDVRVDIVTYSGKFVRTVYAAKNQLPATRTLYWDGKDASGKLVSAGKYRVKLTCGRATPRTRTFTVKR